MSLYFDLVINCDLREDTPEDYIQAIRYWTDANFELDIKPIISFTETPELAVENLWDVFGNDEHFLATDLARETFAHFRKMHRTTLPLENNREVHQYVLQYAARWLHDDWFYDTHLRFVAWLATISLDGFMGYYRETNDPRQWTHLLFSENRALKIVDVDSPNKLHQNTAGSTN